MTTAHLQRHLGSMLDDNILGEGLGHDKGLTAKLRRRRSNLMDMSHDMSIQFGLEVPCRPDRQVWVAQVQPGGHEPRHGDPVRAGCAVSS